MGEWYLVFCKPRQELRAQINLDRQGYTVFRPTINIVKSKIGCKHSIKPEALFPRYLFVKIDLTKQAISPVVSTFGVANFIKFGDSYATASEDLINEIRRNTNRPIPLVTGEGVYKNGDEVFVDGHGFNHIKAIYCNPCGTKRAMILINILGKESKVIVPGVCLSKTG